MPSKDRNRERERERETDQERRGVCLCKGGTERKRRASRRERDRVAWRQRETGRRRADGIWVVPKRWGDLIWGARSVPVQVDPLTPWD